VCRKFVLRGVHEPIWGVHGPHALNNVIGLNYDFLRKVKESGFLTIKDSIKGVDVWNITKL
jgi:hypothetical protein